MANMAMGFIEETACVREMRSCSTGNSQEKHILISTQIRFICIVNLTLVLAGSQQTCNGGVFRFSVFQGIGLGDRRADRNWAVRLAAATMGIDLSVQVGRALISYSNQALRTGHW